jgi:hypothetical protein
LRRTVLVAIFSLTLLSLPFVHADRGMIPVSAGVSVYEPGQKAILAWNGYEEIMILSTDVTSSGETLVLEILPLPSLPAVEAASFQAFERIQSFIWEEGMSLFNYGTLDKARSGSVEVVFHEEIGLHNITAVKAEDSSELVDWMRDFLERNGVDEETSLQNFEPVVEDYMNRGFRHYVLDLITVSSEEKSVDPILYRFNSSFLYYPLVISSPIDGNTQITLFLLTEEKAVTDYWPMQPAHYFSFQGVRPIQFVLSKGELSKIDLRIGEIFQDSAWLTVLEFDGHLSSLQTDLMISSDASTNTPINIEVSFPATLIAMCILLGAASALAGVVSTLLITRLRRKPEKAN